MMLRRALASPTGPCAWVPWSSGPRWRIIAIIRVGTSAGTGPSAKCRMPAMPHIAGVSEQPLVGQDGPHGGEAEVLEETHETPLGLVQVHVMADARQRP